MNHKLRQRLFPILTHAMSRIILPLLHVVVSLMVTRLGAITLWGEFVPVLIFVALSTQIMAWGNSGHLLREFSRTPHKIAAIWQTSLISRLPLFGLCALAGFFIGLPFSRQVLLLLWIFAAFLYTSCEVVILYKKKFVLAVILETGGFMLVVILLLGLRNRLSLEMLIAFFGLAAWLKTLAAGFCFRNELFAAAVARFDLSFLRNGFMFFIPGFCGLLQSRMDLYCAAYFLPARLVGQYQILISLLLYAQALATFVATPYIKNFYRLPASSWQKINALIGRMGIVLPALSMLAIYLLLSRGYQIHFSSLVYFTAYLFVLPFYWYFAKIYQLIKADRQQIVAAASLVGSALNLLLSVALIPKLEIAGALIAGTIVQWVLFFFYSSYAGVEAKASFARHQWRMTTQR